MAKKRATKAGVIGVDVDARESAQPAHVDGRLRELEPVRGGDHVDAGQTGGRAREGARVGELAAEIEAAQKGEDLAQGRAGGGAQPEDQVEAGTGAQHERRALPPAVGGGEQEDAAHLRPAATDLLPSRASTRGSFWRVFEYFAQGSVLSPARRRGRFTIV